MIPINPDSQPLNILKQNQTISDFALSHELRANYKDFKGHAQTSNRDDYKFSSFRGEESPTQVKVVYISPYNGFWSDLLVSIKRIFTGIIFKSFNPADLIYSNSIGGNLSADDIKKITAGTTFISHLEQGRRITIFLALDGSQAEASMEENQESLFFRIYKVALCLVESISAQIFCTKARKETVTSIS